MIRKTENTNFLSSLFQLSTFLTYRAFPSIAGSHFVTLFGKTVCTVKDESLKPNGSQLSELNPVSVA